MIALLLALLLQSGLKEVRFYVDGVLIRRVTATGSGPVNVSTTWDLTGVPNGPHKIWVEAEDNAGNVGKSAVNTVNVYNPDTINPVVTIYQPLNNAQIGGRYVVRAGATDNVKVARMELWLDGQQRTVSAGGVISYQLPHNLKRGQHYIEVRAYDGAGNKGFQAITVYR